MSEGYVDGDVCKLSELSFYIIGEFGCDGVILDGVGLDEDDFSMFVQDGMYTQWFCFFYEVADGATYDGRCFAVDVVFGDDV